MNINAAGVSVSEAGRALMLLSGRSNAYIRAIEAKAQGDWYAYSQACEEVSDLELALLAKVNDITRKVVFTKENMADLHY